MEREFKKLVEEFELANHYQDIACDILKKIEIDSSFPKYILENKDKFKKWIV